VEGSQGNQRVIVFRFSRYRHSQGVPSILLRIMDYAHRSIDKA
jgi:hypothetical protein